MNVNETRFTHEDTIITDKLATRTVETKTTDDAELICNVLNFYYEEYNKHQEIFIKLNHTKYLIEKALANNEIKEDTLKQLLEFLE